MEILWQDIRYGLRTMRRNPVFTAVAVLSLAIGIGANTAIFSLLDTLMLRTLPVERPEELVEPISHYPGEPPCHCLGDYEYFRDNNHVFSGVIATSATTPLQIRRQNRDVEVVSGGTVTGNFFEVLGVKPASGRLFNAADDQKGAAPVAVVSWTYWKRAFNENPAIVGQQLNVQGISATVVGVTARNFQGMEPGVPRDIWLPNTLLPSPGQLIFRLKPGVSIQQAQAELIVLRRPLLEKWARTNSFDPSILNVKTELQSASRGLGVVRDQYGNPLLVLMASVGLLLALACTNVASILLARGAARERELAVRVATGAGRLRLVRQVLTETVMLSVAGGITGAGIASLGVEALQRMIAGARFGPISQAPIEVHPDFRVIAFTVGIMLASGLLFGLVPAVQAFRSNPSAALRTARTGDSRGRRSFGKSLVVSQVALSMALLSAAALFVSYVSNLQNDNLGFVPQNLLTFRLDTAATGLERPQRVMAFRDLLARIERIPGVRSASVAGWTPISGAGASGPMTIEGYEHPATERRLIVWNGVGPRYLETLGTRLLAGRDFKSDDRGPLVAIINETMATRYFKGRSPLGQHVTLNRQQQTFEVIGVMQNTKMQELREEELGLMYTNTFQIGVPVNRFIVRTTGESSAIVPEIRRLVREQMKSAEVMDVKTLSGQIDASIVPERLIALLSGTFGAVGAALAALGLYGLLAFTVAKRTNEIGIRRALGGTRSHVMWIVWREALGMTVAGLLIAAPCVYFGRSLAASLIADLPVTAAAPAIFGAVAMLVIALLASWIPANRAARVDPMVALRQD